MDELWQNDYDDGDDKLILLTEYFPKPQAVGCTLAVPGQ